MSLAFSCPQQKKKVCSVHNVDISKTSQVAWPWMTSDNALSHITRSLKQMCRVSSYRKEQTAFLMASIRAAEPLQNRHTHTTWCASWGKQADAYKPRRSPQGERVAVDPIMICTWSTNRAGLSMSSVRLKTNISLGPAID